MYVDEVNVRALVGSRAWDRFDGVVEQPLYRVPIGGGQRGKSPRCDTLYTKCTDK